jgi:hypothetical protein
MQQPPTSSSPSNERPSEREPSDEQREGREERHAKGGEERGERQKAGAGREQALRDAADWLRHQLERPTVGAAAAGGAILAAAVFAGLTEAIVGAGGAYVVYRMLRRRSSKHAR